MKGKVKSKQAAKIVLEKIIVALISSPATLPPREFRHFGCGLGGLPRAGC
jgi:hypothetical protein